MGIDLNSSNFAETIGKVGSDPKNKYITKSQQGHSYRLDSKKRQIF